MHGGCFGTPKLADGGAKGGEEQEELGSGDGGVEPGGGDAR
jgi:hypothetical protein